MGAPITGDCRTYVLTNFFFLHCEILTLKPEKSLSYQIKVNFVREPGKAKFLSWNSHSSDCLVYKHLFIHFKFPDEALIFVEAEQALSMRAIICYQKPYFKKTLFF